MPLLSRLSPRMISMPSSRRARRVSSCSRRRSACRRCRRGSSPTGASCSDKCRKSARRPGRCRCTCRTLRSSGGLDRWARSRCSRRDFQRRAPKRPCLRRRHERSDSRGCSADDRSRPPATTAVLRDAAWSRRTSIRAAPYLKVMSCSSHSPPASHTGQSSGWLPSSSSIVALRACLISSVSVATIMPSATGVVQAVCSFGIFSMRTTHMRHAA